MWFCVTSGSPMGLFPEENWGCKQFAWIQVQISCALAEIHESKPLRTCDQEL